MSYKAYSTTKKTSTSTSKQTPFCKVCYDAKRPGYDTHYLKDFKGPTPVVVCPYLLELKCNYCKNTGHTVSYCEVLKAKKTGERSSSASSQNGNFFIMRESTSGSPVEPPKKTKTLNHPVTNSGNQFDVLFMEDAEEEEDAAVAAAVDFQQKKVRFDETEMEIAPTPTMMTWAKIVATPAPLQKKQQDKIQQRSPATAAPYERPYPTFIHQKEPESSVASDDNNKISKYFFKPSNKDWWEDSSDDDDA